jgi:hypothetical protein
VVLIDWDLVDKVAHGPDNEDAITAQVLLLIRDGRWQHSQHLNQSDDTFWFEASAGSASNARLSYFDGHSDWTSQRHA